MNQLIWYPKCTTCQAARKVLDNYGIPYTLRDIKEERLNVEELCELVKKSNLTVQQFFNTSGMKYRELNLKDQMEKLSDEEKMVLLASDGMLVKRPIFVTTTSVIVGKKEKEYEKLTKI